MRMLNSFHVSRLLFSISQNTIDYVNDVMSSKVFHQCRIAIISIIKILKMKLSSDLYKVSN